MPLSVCVIPCYGVATGQIENSIILQSLRSNMTVEIIAHQWRPNCNWHYRPIMLYFEKDTNNETVYGTWMTFKGHCHWQLHNSIGHMLSVVCSNHVPIIHRFWDMRRRIMACHWNLGTGQSPCEFIHELYIAVIYRPGAIFFVADSMRLSSFRSTQPPQRAPEELYRVRWCVTVI